VTHFQNSAAVCVSVCLSVCLSVSLVRRYDEMADKLSGHPEDTEALVNLQHFLNTVSRRSLLFVSSHLQYCYTRNSQGRSDGGMWVFIPPKSAQVNFLWGKSDVRTAIQQLYTPPKKLLYPSKQISAYAQETHSRFPAPKCT